MGREYLSTFFELYAGNLFMALLLIWVSCLKHHGFMNKFYCLGVWVKYSLIDVIARISPVWIMKNPLTLFPWPFQASSLYFLGLSCFLAQDAFTTFNVHLFSSPRNRHFSKEVIFLVKEDVLESQNGGPGMFSLENFFRITSV